MICTKISAVLANPILLCKGYGVFIIFAKTGPDKAFSSVFLAVYETMDTNFTRTRFISAQERLHWKSRGFNLCSHGGCCSPYKQYLWSQCIRKYLVLEHHTMTPKLYSLYGHLASIDSTLKIGSIVKVAQAIERWETSLPNTT